MKLINICLSSAGRRVELAKSLRQDAASLGLKLRIVGVDSNPTLSAACLEADASFSVPRCDAKDYIECLVKVCQQNQIDLVIPTIDTELSILADAAEVFAQKRIKVLISSKDAILIARDKLLTVQALAKKGIPVPKTAPFEELVKGGVHLKFPIVLKRIDGSSSIGLHFAENLDKAKSLGLDSKAYIAQEKLEGPEYTVNCFVDANGLLRTVVPHRRIETRGGEVSKGVTERREDLQKLAEQIVDAVPGLRGPFCFQIILTEAGPKVFEINARFGGGYPLAHAAGATFGKWIIEDALGLPSTAHNSWQDGLLMLRYDAAVFAPKEKES